MNLYKMSYKRSNGEHMTATVYGLSLEDAKDALFNNGLDTMEYKTVKLISSEPYLMPKNGEIADVVGEWDNDGQEPDEEEW